MIMIVQNDEAPLIALGIKQALDSDEWAVSRLAQLRAAGERATACVQWYRAIPVGFVFEVKVRRADGSLESQPRPELATCACGERFQPNDGIGGDRCSACAEKGSSRS